MTRNRTATPVAEDDADTVDITEADVETLEEVTEAEDDTFSAKALASELGLDPKAFRRWLRNYTKERANKGGRWAFTADRKSELIDAYNAAHAPAAAEEVSAEA